MLGARQGPGNADSFNPAYNRAAPMAQGPPPARGPSGSAYNGSGGGAGAIPSGMRAGFDEGPGIRNTESYVPRAQSGRRYP